MKIYIPKIPITDVENIPMFYLMGPVLGGNDWQTLACRLFLEQMGSEEFAIIVPNRWSEDHILQRYFLRDYSVPASQTIWERHGLYLAGRSARRGCIVCWLPEESKTNPRRDGQPYGRDTRGEIGEWRTHLEWDENVRFAIGAESGFPGLKQIQENFDAQIQPKFPIYPDLEMTVSAAIGIAVYNERSIPSRSL